MRSYGGLLERRKSNLTPLESTFNAEHFIHMQVVLVYLEWFRRNSLLNCVLQLKITKKFTKNPYFGGSRSFKVIDVGTPESSSAVLVMIRSKSVSIGNHSRARLVDGSRNRTFSSGYPNLMRS